MAVSERDEAGRAWGREWGWEEVAELVAVSVTTALCCALRFPTLPPSDPAPRGLPALGKNITAEGKPLPVTSRGCLQLERSFKDGLGTRGAWAGTLPTMAQWIHGSHLTSATICLLVLLPAEPCHSRHPSHIPSRVPGASTVLPARQKGREVLAPRVLFAFIPLSAGDFTINLPSQAWGGALCLCRISSRQGEKRHLSFCAFPTRL